jgi:hypothetical protein
MKKFGRAFLILGAGLLSGLALAASAAGTPATSGAKVRHLPVPVAALAMDGSRIAYDTSARYATNPHATNRVLVWNVRTGKTLQVSGKKTADADDSSTGAGVFQLAIAGSRVAWLANEGGNLEGDDYLFTSSLSKPKEHQVASAIRMGDSCPGRSQGHCAGKWLGGVVGSGSLIAANRWTTDATGAVTAGELDLLSGTRLKQIATGVNTVQAAVADAGRIAVLRADGTVGLYSTAGKLLLTVNTPPNTTAIALGGKSLVAVTRSRQLLLYNAHTGSLRKTLSVHGVNQPRNLDLQGDIAIYSVGSALHAVNLSSGKDRVVEELRGGSLLAQIDVAGLVYASVRNAYRNGTKLAFVPFTQIAAAVG